MKSVKFFLSGEMMNEPHIIEVDEQASISEVLVMEFGPRGVQVEDVMVLLENENEPRPHGEQVQGHFRHHDHIHCHRCKDVEITFSYNNKVRSEKVPPSTTGGKLIELISKLYNVSKSDAENLNLEISSDVHVAKNDHIGRFVSYPECRLHISLTDKNKING